MPQRQLTTIDLPHKVLELVGPILEKAGFTVGTTGGGWTGMEREGAIGDAEKKQLVEQMAVELFDFDIDDIEDD